MPKSQDNIFAEHNFRTRSEETKLESNERQGSEQELNPAGAHTWEGSVCWNGQARMEKDNRHTRKQQAGDKFGRL